MFKHFHAIQNLQIRLHSKTLLYHLNKIKKKIKTERQWIWLTNIQWLTNNVDKIIKVQ